ncbi:hypothetical protein G7068_13070 [Leucobacter viscericola]|uniref:Uncharacterized protein n=1 Tax=Leucobacter viscericola TaxID=2714935 RepID=A0A6G7XHD6_9MICO|nr:hypothetical protein [Leucobacter viscericola]QIK64024.1 hypothetical protein G7068_13070 [Leucobacter viscericola]
MTLMNQMMWIAEKNAEFDPDKVTPGVAGFVMVAVLAGAIILLGFSLVKRLRRNAYRSEIREDIANELAAGEAQDPEPRG